MGYTKSDHCCAESWVGGREVEVEGTSPGQWPSSGTTQPQPERQTAQPAKLPCGLGSPVKA